MADQDAPAEEKHQLAGKNLNDIMKMILNAPAKPRRETAPKADVLGYNKGKNPAYQGVPGCSSLLLSLLSPNSPITSSLILSYLSTPTILKLTKVCKSLRHITSIHWNIDAHLRRWVSSPGTFRSLLSSTGAICGGSDALQFLLREEWDCDLNIYIDHRPGAAEWCRYLDQEGYSFDPADMQPAPIVDGMISAEASLVASFDETMEELSCDQTGATKDPRWQVLFDMGSMKGFHGFIHPKDPSKRVKLIITTPNPLRCILRSFPITPAFCLYTGSKCYSLFPYQTFVKRVQFPTGRGGYDFLAYQKKYLDLGFEHGQQPRNPAKWPMRRHRRITDGHSWVIKFQTDSASEDDALFDTTTFSMKYKTGRFTRGNSYVDESMLPLGIAKFKHPSLRRAYLVDDHEEADLPWVETAEPDRLGEYSWATFLRRKLEKYEEMHGYVDPYHSEGFKYDEYLEELYKEWSAGAGGEAGRQLVYWKPSPGVYPPNR